MPTPRGRQQRSKRSARHLELDPKLVVEAFFKYHWPMHLHVLPGGIRPATMTDGANGYDCSARAILSSDRMDPEFPKLRETLFDFKNPPPDEKIRGHIQYLPDGHGGMEFVYRLNPGQRVLVGVGFATAMPHPMYCDLKPRSGLASKYGIQLANSPGMIDSDYNGEGGAILINHGADPFDIRHGARICQAVFGFSIHPRFIQVPTLADLPETKRGAGGFGSTGLQ